MTRVAPVRPGHARQPDQGPGRWGRHPLADDPQTAFPRGVDAVLTRRETLRLLGGVAAAGVLPSPVWLPSAATAATVPTGFGGSRPLRAAMHVHGSWSEGAGSWEAQFEQAAANGYDLLYLTDHDTRAMALNYMTSLAGATWDPVVSQGTFAQKSVTVGNGSVRIVAESAGTTAATVSLPLEPRHQAFNKLRTSISGLTISLKVSSATLTGGARFQVEIPLSYHPAQSGRPAGQYRLIYRFGGTTARWTEGNGLTGIVAAPTPAPGSVRTLVPTQDVAVLWPGMKAVDNASYGLSLVGTSPRRTAVCEVSVASMTFTRARSTPARVTEDRAGLISAYAPLHPGLTARATVETSRTLPDMNVYGTSPWFPDYATLSTNSDLAHQQIADQVHAQGGLISYNHPFGYDTGPLLAPAERDAKRRQLFTSMQAVGRFSADILEVGYSLRGQVDTAAHLALWDTFSRSGVFLTGNGVSDDHSGQNWRTMQNGFGTGVWAASAGDADMVAALQGGRVYTARDGRWPGAELDLLVDGAVPMGAVSVSSLSSRSLALWAKNLPIGSAVQVIGGLVDYAGATDPATWVKSTLTPSSFSGNIASMSVTTSTSRFFRAQVLDSTGAIIGASNPVWLLRSEPPAGIPPARRSA